MEKLNPMYEVLYTNYILSQYSVPYLKAYELIKPKLARRIEKGEKMNTGKILDMLVGAARELSQRKLCQP